MNISNDRSPLATMVGITDEWEQERMVDALILNRQQGNRLLAKRNSHIVVMNLDLITRHVLQKY